MWAAVSLSSVGRQEFQARTMFGGGLEEESFSAVFSEGLLLLRLISHRHR